MLLNIAEGCPVGHDKSQGNKLSSFAFAEKLCYFGRNEH
jgi:hypothetical protein